ncbi:MAG TPA: hypothetical protein VK177_00865 [Flavobacteriales bacterium]|nr:hypothetical protein [Flavobacteriales bacterium]
MIVLYIVAGINHFINPQFYLKIMPPYIPYHLAMVYVSGVCEIGFALLLIPPKTRRVGAWLIIFMLIAIFPANIQMAIDWYAQDHPQLWAAFVRLPLQLVLIWWAWLYAKKINSLKN